MDDAKEPPSELTVASETSRSLDASQSRAVHVVQYTIDANPKLSISDLMLITGICAITIALVRASGIFGVLALFVVCCTATAIRRTYCQEPTRYRVWNQFIWGVLMPIGCIFGDPFVFGSFDLGTPSHIEGYAYACYTFMAWQMLCLCASWIVSLGNQFANAFLGGTLICGATFALIIAVLLTPIAAIGLLVLVGALGLTPWFTGFVYLKTGLMHMRRVQQKSGTTMAFSAAGFLLPIVVAASVLLATRDLKFGSRDFIW